LEELRTSNETLAVSVTHYFALK